MVRKHTPRRRRTQLEPRDDRERLDRLELRPAKADVVVNSEGRLGRVSTLVLASVERVLGDSDGEDLGEGYTHGLSRSGVELAEVL